MPHTPWAGLAALIAMFVIPLLPSTLFEGRRTTKHWPHRDVCGECGAAWTARHRCAPEPLPADPAAPAAAPAAPAGEALPAPLRGELRRLPGRDLERPRPPRRAP